MMNSGAAADVIAAALDPAEVRWFAGLHGRTEGTGAVLRMRTRDSEEEWSRQRMRAPSTHLHSRLPPALGVGAHNKSPLRNRRIKL